MRQRGRLRAQQPVPEMLEINSRKTTFTRRGNMLVLTRKCLESIHVRDDIIVTVLAVHGNRIRIGIEAPRAISIQRGEIFEAISQHSGGAFAAAGSGPV
jgi:carbon storage regulator